MKGNQKQIGEQNWPKKEKDVDRKSPGWNDNIFKENTSSNNFSF